MFGLAQFVHFPTRGENVLDIIMSNDDQIINNIYSAPPIGHSDHAVVNFTLGLKYSYSSKTSYSSNVKTKYIGQRANTVSVAYNYDWQKADYELIAMYLNKCDWYSLIYNNPSAQSAWYAFLSMFWTAIDCPKAGKMDTGNKKPRCYPRYIRRCMAKKKKAWRRCVQNPSSAICHQRYSDCTNELRVLIDTYVSQTEKHVIESYNLGTFYRYINKRISHRPNIGALTDDTGNNVTGDLERAELFNCHFASVGVVDNGFVPKWFCRMYKHCGSKLDTVHFDDESIVADKLKTNLSSGPDGLPPLFFKQLKFCLAKPSV